MAAGAVADGTGVGRVSKNLIEFRPGNAFEFAGGGARKAFAVESGTQSHHPYPLRQVCAMAQHGRANLPLQQASGHGATRVSLGHN